MRLAREGEVGRGAAGGGGRVNARREACGHEGRRRGLEIEKV